MQLSNPLSSGCLLLCSSRLCGHASILGRASCVVCCWLVFSSGQFFALRLPADTLACLNQPDSLTAPPGVRYKCEQSIRAACECWLGERLTRLKLGSLVFRHQQLRTAQQMLIERTLHSRRRRRFLPKGRRSCACSLLHGRCLTSRPVWCTRCLQLTGPSLGWRQRCWAV